MPEFNNVKELIKFLEPYKDRALILDDDGNTYPVTIDVWNENDPESPIAIKF